MGSCCVYGERLYLRDGMRGQRVSLVPFREDWVFVRMPEW